MKNTELRQIVLNLYEKGYSWEKIKYSDDLYNATAEELEYCFECYNELKQFGIANFEINP